MKHLLIITVIASLAAVASIFLTPTPANAVKASDFNPGFIIDDNVFYNNSSMSVDEIQKFLNSKSPNCDTNGTKPASDWGRSDITHATLASYIRNGTNGYTKDTGFHAPPYTCTKDYKQNTPQMEAASGLCGPLAKQTNNTAARIIKDISDACGINPQVLIVLLEKEQSLITDSWPLARQFTKATGFDCPDTAPCDPAYAGFFYQVYYAAKQFKIYQKYPNDYNYVAGRTNRIYWHPDLSRCGSSQVFIENQATAALYVYTPYRPNQAALNNMYGTGDSCSSYGNRNFWRLFSDWFGNPQNIKGKIGTRWNEIGGVSKLGIPLSSEACSVVNSVKSCSQQFKKGTIYYTAETGAWEVIGKIGARYADLPASKLGYPTNPESCSTENDTKICYQNFEKGSIYYSSPTGAWEVIGKIGERWSALGLAEGPLGLPLGAEVCSVINEIRTCSQEFSNNTIYYTAATGAWEVKGKIGARWLETGGPNSTLGMPKSAEMVNAKNEKYQVFQHGSIYYTKAKGTWIK